jgi:glucokinase
MLAIGCDLGATHMRVALIDVAKGRIVARRKQASRVGEYALTMKALANEIIELQKLAKGPCTVGVAVAGQLDAQRERVILAPNLAWSRAPLVRDLRERVGAVVRMENDVRAAARGEAGFGALRGQRGTAFCVYWGSGVGGAIVLDGEVVPGALALAGEIGHLTYRAGGRACPCGKRGCIEAYSGGHVLDRAARRMKLANGAALTRAARNGDARAAAVMTQAKAAVGQLIGNLTTALDPSCVVVGGSIGLSLFRELRPYVTPHLLPARSRALTLVRGELGDDAGLFGAALLS